MDKPRSFYVVDDDPLILELVRTLLEGAGHRVTTAASSVEAVAEIEATKPDCVLTDIMMPGLDGMELCQKICGTPELGDTKVVILSVKSYDFDRRRARELGASGYVLKPIEPATFVDQLTAILAQDITVTYWGVRGTLPVPGQKSLKYGGNTPCVTMSFPGDHFFIFDAGTGIKELSNHLMGTQSGPLVAKLFLSHPHWDHIQGFPFFAPLYIPGNEIEICGAAHGDLTVRELVSGQMEGVYFPITIRKFGARVFFRDLREESFDIDDIHIQTMLLSHPGYCLGYRLTHRGRVICYVTDNEMFTPDLPQYSETYIKRLTEFVSGADILITDSSYTDEEYPSKVEFGHSCISQVVKLAHDAEVKALHLFHHDPDQNDDDIDRKFASARSGLEDLDSDVTCLAPAEGESFQL